MLSHLDTDLASSWDLCDASGVGDVGVVLLHKYSDGSERPISNASMTLTITQWGYSLIQKEAFDRTGG